MKPFGLAWEGFGEAVGEVPGAAPLEGWGRRAQKPRGWVSGPKAENGDSQGPGREGGSGVCNHCFYFQKPIGNPVYVLSMGFR